VSPKDKLFEVLKAREPIIAPGGWDALSAKMIQNAGFKVCFLTGGGMTASLLCKPDRGVITLTEMVNQVRYICEAIEIPVIADGDSGFGNALNAMRTVTEMEMAGAAAVAIEDKITPPDRNFSPQTPGTYPLEVAVRKVKAAVKGIRRGEIAVVARTDEPKVEAAIERGKAYVQAGAELFFPHGHPNGFSPSDLRKIGESVGVPTIVNLPLLRGEYGRQPSASDFAGSLAKILIFPREAINAGLAASMRVLQQIRKEGKALIRPEDALGPELAQLLNMDEWAEWEEKYLPLG